MRVEDKREISHFTVARSKDEISNWKIDAQPTMMPCQEEYPKEIWWIEYSRLAVPGSKTVPQIVKHEDFYSCQCCNLCKIPLDSSFNIRRAVFTTENIRAV